MREVRYEAADGVAVITLAAPERRNALTPQLAAELASASTRPMRARTLARLSSVVDSRSAPVLTLAPSTPFDPTPAGDTNYRAIEVIYEAFLRVGNATVQTIAAVRGAPVGAGVNLALATDLRIVAHDALLRSGFARIGAHPGGGHFTC